MVQTSDEMLSKDIELTGWSLSYGKVEVLRDISCKFPHGKIVVLLGSSGAGKTSLLRSLNFLERANKGTLKIAGFEFDCSKDISPIKIRELRQKLGMVFQQYELWPHMKVIENLTYAAKLQKIGSVAEIEQRALGLLSRLNIAELKDRYPSQLSGGQQQRVAIARALMMTPEVLLFDEPTAALDPQATIQVAEIIKDLSTTGVSQIIVTHDVNFARLVADKVIYLYGGMILEEGGKEIFTNPVSEEFSNYLSHNK